MRWPGKSDEQHLRFGMRNNAARQMRNWGKKHQDTVLMVEVFKTCIFAACIPIYPNEDVCQAPGKKIFAARGKACDILLSRIMSYCAVAHRPRKTYNRIGLARHLSAAGAKPQTPEPIQVPSQQVFCNAAFLFQPIDFTAGLQNWIEG